MKTAIKIMLISMIMVMASPAYVTANPGKERTGQQVARDNAKWSVKGGKKTMKSIRKFTKKSRKNG
jgi:hypothetical protein